MTREKKNFQFVVLISAVSAIGLAAVVLLAIMMSPSKNIGYQTYDDKHATRRIKDPRFKGSSTSVSKCTPETYYRIGVGERQNKVGFRTCVPTEINWGGACQNKTEEKCDRLDNDCDGSTDEGCACPTGYTRKCGASIGQCQQGIQKCESANPLDRKGVLSHCTRHIAPSVEVCDKIDNDCDGQTDEECVKKE